MRKEKWPRPGQGNAAGKLCPDRSYLANDDLQTAGLECAERVHEIVEQFISSYYRALTDEHGPAMQAAFQRTIASDLELPVEALPGTALQNIFRILAAFAEAGIKPTVAAIQKVSRHGLPIISGGGDELAELRLILERECSAAGIQNYARLLNIAYRRRMRAARLWRAMRDRIDNPFNRPDRQTIPLPTTAHQSKHFSSRAIARVLGA